MSYKRILTIQDISCFGQCSLTVALPILSACGVETCILPSAVLSTHTGGFTGYTFRDLTDDMPAIAAHWKKENISFDAIYTGYLGSKKQISHVMDIMKTLTRQNGLKIVDPAMADNGRLYTGFDMDFVREMKNLCSVADILLPNITEACLLTGTEFRTEYDELYINTLLDKLASLTIGTIILTGVSYSPVRTGVIVFEKGESYYYSHRRIAVGCHGTGDVYASAFTGSLLRGNTNFESAKIAADFTLRCIENTKDDTNHRYGVKFETALPYLIERLNLSTIEDADIN